MYLVAGMVARNVAGPGVVISFIIAAVASVFSGKIFPHLSGIFKTIFASAAKFSCKNLHPAKTTAGY